MADDEPLWLVMPSVSWIVLAAAAVGLVVNTATVLGVAWKGGNLLGRMQEAMGTLSGEVSKLRDRRHDDANILTRVVANLDDLERRVADVETEQRNRRNGG